VGISLQMKEGQGFNMSNSSSALFIDYSARHCHSDLQVLVHTVGYFVVVVIWISGFLAGLFLSKMKSVA
jgi:hypothetical protein